MWATLISIHPNITAHPQNDLGLTAMGFYLLRVAVLMVGAGMAVVTAVHKLRISEPLSNMQSDNTSVD